MKTFFLLSLHTHGLCLSSVGVSVSWFSLSIWRVWNAFKSDTKNFCHDGRSYSCEMMGISHTKCVFSLSESLKLIHFISARVSAREAELRREERHQCRHMWRTRCAKQALNDTQQKYVSCQADEVSPLSTLTTFGDRSHDPTKWVNQQPRIRKK